MFVPCRSRDLSTELLGQRYAMPFGVTPMGLCNLAWPGTELGIAAAAARAGIPYALSTMASGSIEDIAPVAPGHTWFQLYVGGDAVVADSLLERALATGIRTLVLTVDANFAARRLRDRRNRFALPLRPTPRLLVSNHGWRQLASVPSPIEAMPAIRRAVGPDFALLLDSGVRSGDDIAKALAAGASFVLRGRAFLYGTGALGAERGPSTTIDILRGELDTAMAQPGCGSITELRSACFFSPLPASARAQ